MHIPNPAGRRLLMGVAMGITAILIIHSPMGKRSGAHFNPAITLTYFRLGKIHGWDAVFYVIFQFCGGIFGVGVSALLLGGSIAAPAVNYAVTVPGQYGTAAAFLAELVHGHCSHGSGSVDIEQTFTRALHQLSGRNSDRVLHPFFRSGFGVQHQSGPNHGIGCIRGGLDRVVALFHRAPAGYARVRRNLSIRFGADRILCAKLHPDPAYPCPFICHYPRHRHR